MNPQKLKSDKDIVIFADVIDSKSYDQVKLISNHPVILDPIRIMPDVHAGAGCVVGFTGKGFSGDFVIPNIIGVDIGCGVSMYPLPDEEIDFEKFDSHLRKYIPLGMTSHEYKGVYQMETFLYSIRNLGFGDYPNVLEKTEEFNKIIKFKRKKDISQLGTLGGGNHFIEIDEVIENNKVLRFLVVHSGSRNFGLRVASHYQREAEKFIEKENINGIKSLYLIYNGLSLII